MKAFIPKLVISLLALYILFELTIGSRIDYFMNIFSDSQTRLEVREKIKSEIKKGLEKENYFTEEERVVLTNFIKKIRKELDLDVNK